ncbi:uncharacterized protein LOC141682667 [Apium graveolens]|uniref:uncharacterized protein LOC141682667 n=1 Tax=Apium graveolens TaxID=4045 RepID=UPI003D79C150
MDPYRNKSRIQIIPENAEFEPLRSLGEESLGDESEGGGDEYNQPQQPEQEEVSRKRKSAVVDSEESNQEKPYQKQQRKKKSRCWAHLDTVIENNQEFAICKFCKKKMIKGSTGCTTTFNRHVDKCLASHGRTNQAVLQLQSSGSKSSEEEDKDIVIHLD